jgi:phage terminase small subunit
MKGRKPKIAALPGALDKAPPAPAWLPKFAKTEWARVVPALVTARSLAQHELSTVESYCLSVGCLR